MLGMLLPVLPTTPFLLLAAICYARSSERFYRRLITNRWCGEYIRNYREGRGIPLKQKVLTILLLWLVIGSTVWSTISQWWIRLILFGIAVGVTVHLVRIKTYKSKTQPYNELAMTKQAFVIRDETESDAAAITQVTVAAFETLSVSDQTERFIIEALRSAKALTVSLVAELDGRIVGHIAFSPVAVSDGATDWYGLGPVSVLPEYQRRGVGKALIQEGLSRLRKLHAKGCCLVGHPQYYRKFGFENVAGLALEGVPQEVFFALSFDGHVPRGAVMFHEAFKANGKQGSEADG